ncbi:Hint domain-containing protein [Pseudoruegeria aquimaris]
MSFGRAARVEEVCLVNVCLPGTEIRLFSGSGEMLRRVNVAGDAQGASSCIALHAEGVTRLEIALSRGAQVADVRYSQPASPKRAPEGRKRELLVGMDEARAFEAAARGEPAPGQRGGVVMSKDGDGEAVVQYRDPRGKVKATMDTKKSESVTVCFTPGTMIATPRGERAVETLKAGDKVITRDNGIQEIRWIGGRPLTWQDLAASPYLQPILVKAGALGNGLPEKDMYLSPNHRVLVSNDKTALYFDEREVLVAAKHLVNNKTILQVESAGTAYIHFMFDHHEVVLSNGSWTESFQPGDHSLKGMGNAQRNEIFELFPELQTHEGMVAYQSARKTLQETEAKMLLN